MIQSLKQKMIALTWILLMGLLVPSQGQAVGLKIVFMDTIWGGAVGTVLGFAVWGINEYPEEEGEESKLGKFLMKGLSFGLIGGMGYGFYEAQEPQSAFSNQIEPFSRPGLVHYDARQNTLFVSPLYAIPALGKTLTGTDQIAIFSGSF